MTERMNMLRIGAPERGTSQRFDIDRDITHEQWTQIYIEANMQRMHGNLWDFTMYLANMRLINPTQTPKIDDEDYEKMSADAPVALDWDKATEYAARVRVIGGKMPDRFEDQANWLKESCEQFRKGNIRLFMRFAVRLRLIAPEASVPITDAEWKKAQNEFLWLKNGQKWGEALLLAGQIKMLDPARTPVFSDADRADVKKFLHGERSNSQDFLVHAAQTKILDADEVRMSDKGLELVMRSHKPVGDKIERLPDAIEL